MHSRRSDNFYVNNGGVCFSSEIRKQFINIPTPVVIQIVYKSIKNVITLVRSIVIFSGWRSFRNDVSIPQSPLFEGTSFRYTFKGAVLIKVEVCRLYSMVSEWDASYWLYAHLHFSYQRWRLKEHQLRFVREECLFLRICMRLTSSGKATSMYHVHGLTQLSRKWFKAAIALCENVFIFLRDSKPRDRYFVSMIIAENGKID